jgi:hypothetical protein
MSEFHEGQEVEVLDKWQVPHGYADVWRKAWIIGVPSGNNSYCVVFSDTTQGVFDADRIRARTEFSYDHGSANTRYWP